jgi:LuxR family maltose regulon positive regulatory protein
LIAKAENFSVPLIKTKLSAPQLCGCLVDRPQLLVHLGNSDLRALTLICAPAGYGKTTFLINWISNLKKTSKPGNPLICWVSLDEADNEPIRFLSYLVAAIETAGNGLNVEACAMLQLSAPPPLQTILAVLINELEKLTTSIYIILDDYQFISNKAIHEGMAFFLDHLPSNTHLVIATRSDPPIPLARLRARGQMTEIRAADLRFSYEETVCFFNQIMEFGLTPEDMTRLDERACSKEYFPNKTVRHILICQKVLWEQPLYSGLSGGGSSQSPTTGYPGFSPPDFNIRESQRIPLRRRDQDPFLEIKKRCSHQPVHP